MKDLIKRVDARLKKIKEEDLSEYIKNFNPDDIMFLDSTYIDGSTLYLKWIYCLALEVQPKQVVELGAWTGASTAMFLAGMPKDSVLYSVDTNKDSWMSAPEDDRLVKIIGDDLDVQFPEGTHLDKTDIWFIDSDHTAEQLNQEVEKYSPFWNKDTIVLIDDVNYGLFSDYSEAWKKLPYNKIELPRLHYTGFGVMVI